MTIEKTNIKTEGAKKNAPKTYAEWLASEGEDARGKYADALDAIERDAAAAMPGYGATAEGLASRGLAASGYADYLGGRAYAERQKLRDAARREYQSGLERNRAGYAEYLSGYASDEHALCERVGNKLLGSGIDDFDTAYNYAVSSGVSEKTAGRLASDAVAKTRAQRKQTVLDRVYRDGIDRTHAIIIALNAGLTKEEAEEIGEFAYQMSLYASGANKNGKKPEEYIEQFGTPGASAAFPFAAFGDNTRYAY